MLESSFAGFARNVVLLLAIVVVFDSVMLRSRSGKGLTRRVVMGLVIGIMGVSVMLTPIVLLPGVIFDTRSVLLGISGLFFGSLPTVIAMVITSAFRLYQGGSGSLTGVLVIISTGSLGIAWRTIRKQPPESMKPAELFLFGIVSHVVMLALMLTLPRGIALRVVAAISLPVMVLYPLGTVMLGLLLTRRIQRENYTDSLRESEERHRAITESLRISETLLSKSQEIAHIGSWELVLASGKLTWTDEVYRIFGARPQEFPADYQTFLGMIPPDDRAAVDASYSDSLRDGKDSYEIEHRIVRKSDGAVRCVHEKCVHVRDASGTVTHSIGMVQDITERRIAEEKLKEAEQESRRLLAELRHAQSIAHVGSWFWDLETGGVTWSDEMYRIFGIDKDSVTGRLGDMIARSIHPDDLHIVQASNAVAFAERKSVEYRIIRPDGSIRHIWAETGDVLLDYSGAPIHLTGTAQDVTVHKLAEQRINALLHEKELLLKGTHHRVKNNMGTMYGLLTLQADAQKDTAAKAVLEDAARRIRSMTMLYDRLYRSENFAEMSIKEFLPSLVSDIVGAFPSVPPVRTDLQVDDVRLSARILANLGIIVNELITNSMKYAFAGRERGLIKVAVRASGATVAIEYGDDGNGLPENVSFEHSTGFGLRLVGMLAEQIGGTVRIDRSEGARFILEVTL